MTFWRCFVGKRCEITRRYIKILALYTELVQDFALFTCTFGNYMSLCFNFRLSNHGGHSERYHRYFGPLKLLQFLRWFWGLKLVSWQHVLQSQWGKWRLKSSRNPSEFRFRARSCRTLLVWGCKFLHPTPNACSHFISHSEWQELTSNMCMRMLYHYTWYTPT